MAADIERTWTNFEAVYREELSRAYPNMGQSQPGWHERTAAKMVESMRRSTSTNVIEWNKEGVALKHTMRHFGAALHTYRAYKAVLEGLK